MTIIFRERVVLLLTTQTGVFGIFALFIYRLLSHETERWHEEMEAAQRAGELGVLQLGLSVISSPGDVFRLLSEFKSQQTTKHR